MRSHELLVVGAGPTGIAALVEAKRLGLDAVGLEAAPGPVASLVGYASGLVLLSDAQQWEVGGLPLDCRDRLAPTREEVISYYARVIAHTGIEVRAHRRVLSVVCEPNDVVLEIEGHPSMRARHVLLTSWYGPKPLPAELRDPSARTVVHQRVPEVAALPGKELVIFGGGVSAFAHAVAGMRAAKVVPVVSRGKLARSFRTPAFRALVRAAGARLYPNAIAVGVRDGAVRFTSEDGAGHRIPCESAIACIGFRVLPDIERMLLGSGASSRDTLERLANARGADAWRRARPTILPEQLLPLVLDGRPDFHDLLYHGHRGVRVAGAALHAGGPDAGVAYSIFTAKVAVARMVGAPAPMLERPLPRGIFHAEASNAVAPLSERACASVVPVAYAGRGTGDFGLTGEARSGATRTEEESGTDGGISSLCDGTRTVEALANARGISLGSALAEVAELLRSGRMTWLPG